MFEKMKEKMRLAKEARIAAELEAEKAAKAAKQAEHERLMQLSEKELLIEQRELLVELVEEIKRLNESVRLSADDICSTIRLWNN